MSLHETNNLLQAMADGIDHYLNGGKQPPKTGWCLLVFGMDAPGIANYVCNTGREDMIKALRETADRLEKKQDNVRYPLPE